MGGKVKRSNKELKINRRPTDASMMLKDNKIRDMKVAAKQRSRDRDSATVQISNKKKLKQMKKKEKKRSLKEELGEDAMAEVEMDDGDVSDELKKDGGDMAEVEMDDGDDSGVEETLKLEL
jgi:hypothetical protein